MHQTFACTRSAYTGEASRPAECRWGYSQIDLVLTQADPRQHFGDGVHSSQSVMPQAGNMRLHWELIWATPVWNRPGPLHHCWAISWKRRVCS